MGVEPQLFLLRWLRLLFGREFHQEDVLVMWDSLFTVLYRLCVPPRAIITDHSSFLSCLACYGCLTTKF